MKTRGVRNNNPFNIRVSNSRWFGKVSSDRNTDGVFEQFQSIDYGVRAGLVLLCRYIKDYRLDSVRAIISRFAPEKENNTRSYIEFVENYMQSYGFTPDTIVFGSPKFACLCCAVLRFESSYNVKMDYILGLIKFYGL